MRIVRTTPGAQIIVHRHAAQRSTPLALRAQIAMIAVILPQYRMRRIDRPQILPRIVIEPPGEFVELRGDSGQSGVRGGGVGDGGVPKEQNIS